MVNNTYCKNCVRKGSALSTLAKGEGGGLAFLSHHCDQHQPVVCARDLHPLSGVESRRHDDDGDADLGPVDCHCGRTSVFDMVGRGRARHLSEA